MPMEAKDITVLADGVKIGWNIMATLAAMGIGMYVYIAIIPLKADISFIKTSVEDMKTEDKALLSKVSSLEGAIDDRIDKCETNGAIVDQRLRTLERHKLPHDR